MSKSKITNLKMVLKLMGIKATSVAAELDMPDAQFSRYANGLIFPRPKMQRRIAEVLGVDAGILFNGKKARRIF
jgi:transcriptional regulator with XRE-family HTH domain